MKRIVLLACFVALSGAVHAQTIATPQSVKWGPGPAVLPPGARAVVLDGDPTKASLFTMRLMFPPGYRVAPHFHEADEHVTVISGVLNVGMGDTFDRKKLTSLHAGSFAAVPAGMHHFAVASGRTIIQIHAMGPWKLTYVNPADAPK